MLTQKQIMERHKKLLDAQGTDPAPIPLRDMERIIGISSKWGIWQFMKRLVNMGLAKEVFIGETGTKKKYVILKDKKCGG